MTRKSSALFNRFFVILALATAAFISTLHSRETAATKMFQQTQAPPFASAPVIVAQGRCYNGHCY